ncbi:MAG: hypothetical protein KGM17_06805 [Sphingomonadales bacterium]|nr:hypothetical protein [Sphingomonadales bacterium]
MGLRHRFERFVDSLVIIPMEELREILSRPHVSPLCRASLLVSMFSVWITTPSFSLEPQYLVESLYHSLTLGTLAIGFLNIQTKRYELNPPAMILFSLLYIVLCVWAALFRASAFPVSLIYFSSMHYLVNSILLRERISLAINLAVFLVLPPCAFAYWRTLPEVAGWSREVTDLVTALSLSTSSLITLHLVLAVRTLSLEKLADARIRVAEMQAERLIAEERLAAREQLARLNRISVLEAMSSSVAHEINQPISAAMTYAVAAQRWLARRQPDIAEAQSALDGALAEIDSVGQRVLTIRALTSQQTREYKPTDLPALVEAQVRLVRSEFERRKVRLSLHCDPARALRRARACPPDIAQVVMNLLSNAIEAIPVEAPDGAVHVEVRAPDSRWAEVRVLDNGCGIPAEQYDAIFQPFHTTKDKGTGLGLSICREIAERHAGTLVLAPAEGGGTIATLRLALRT